MSSALADRVGRLCRADHSATRLRELVPAEIRTSIPFSGHVFACTDPATAVVTDSLADVPGLDPALLPDLVRARYLTPSDRWDTVRGNGAHSLLGTTEGEPDRSLLWRGVERALGITDTAIVTFADRYGCWGFLELLRYRESPFTPGELAAVSALTAAISTALRATVGATFAESTDQPVPPGAATVLLDDTLRVRSHTTADPRPRPPGEPVPPVPTAVRHTGAALLAAEAGIPLGPPSARIHLGGNRRLTVRAERRDAGITVSLAPSTATERLDLFARAHGLSARESQVLTLLATGLDARELAVELALPEHTVDDHVRAILAKSGARTRRRLLAQVLGLG